MGSPPPLSFARFCFLKKMGNVGVFPWHVTMMGKRRVVLPFPIPPLPSLVVAHRHPSERERNTGAVLIESKRFDVPGSLYL